MRGRRLGPLPDFAILALVAAVLTTGLLGVGLTVGAATDAALPSVASLEHDLDGVEDLSEAARRATSRFSTVYAADGSVIGRFQPEELHVALKATELPSTLKTAVVAAEDQRFWEHRCFDGSAVIRAALSNTIEGTVTQGGSTITQQLAKNLFTGDDRTLTRKVQELRTALALEKRFTKDEILTAYLNSIYFGSQAFGVEAAAQTYFRKTTSELTLGEAALLAGVIPAPTEFNPRLAPDESERKRQGVLDRVAETGGASPEEIAAAREERPTIHPPQLTIERFPYYLDYVRIFLLEQAGLAPERLYGGGLHIHTALDPAVQDAARQAVAEHLPDPGGPTAAVVILEPTTGAVIAVVGGREWNESNVNLALGQLGAGSGRQPGSSFKAFVLATAYEEGWSPEDVVDAPEEYLPRTVPDPEPVQNYTNRGYGRVTVRQATINSINTAFVGMTEELGAGEVAKRARDLGIRLPPPEDVGPSIGIGAYETSPLEMAAAYAAFAVDGRRVHPSPVTGIEVSEGDPPVELPIAGPGNQVLQPDTARLVSATLADVIRRGTATGAEIGRPAAAKTGTSDNHENAWLVGYTPQLAAAVWIGHEEGNVPMTDINGVARVTGGSLPALVWRDVMSVAHQGKAVAHFTPPPHRPPGGADNDGSGEARPPRARNVDPSPDPAGPGSAPPASPQPPAPKPAPRPPTALVEDPFATAREKICPHIPSASICDA